MEDAPVLGVDPETITAEIFGRIDAAGLPGMAVLEEPVIGPIVRLETAVVVREIFSALHDPGTVEVCLPAESRHAARIAARHAVPLESLTKTYRIGHSVIQDQLLESLRSSPSTRSASIARIQRLFVIMESLIELVVGEYHLELAQLAASSSEPGRLRHVQRVLQETDDQATLDFYPLGRTHTAVVATGPIRETATKLARARPGVRVAVDADEDLTWAWFTDLDATQVTDALRQPGTLGVAGVGGPVSGVAGFRNAHRQSALALEVAMASQLSVANYRQAGLAAIGLSSRIESRTLIEHQLGSLTADTPRNRELCRTLAAYVDSGHSVRSAAAILAVSERTVSNRLASARRRLPDSTDLRSVELALALRLNSTLGNSL